MKADLKLKYLIVLLFAGYYAYEVYKIYKEYKSTGVSKIQDNIKGKHIILLVFGIYYGYEVFQISKESKSVSTLLTVTGLFFAVMLVLNGIDYFLNKPVTAEEKAYLKN